MTVTEDRQPVLYIIISVLSSIMILSLLLSLSHFCRRKSLERLSSKIEAEKPHIQLVSQSTPLLTTSDAVSTNNGNGSKADPSLKELLPRKVSFCEHCHTSSTKISDNNKSTGSISNIRTNNIQKTVVRSYSIDKLRPRCYTCNPSGDTPYPLPRFPVNSDSSEDYYDNV